MTGHSAKSGVALILGYLRTTALPYASRFKPDMLKIAVAFTARHGKEVRGGGALKPPNGSRSLSVTMRNFNAEREEGLPSVQIFKDAVCRPEAPGSRGGLANGPMTEIEITFLVFKSNMDIRHVRADANHLEPTSSAPAASTIT